MHLRVQKELAMVTSEPAAVFLETPGKLGEIPMIGKEQI